MAGKTRCTRLTHRGISVQVTRKQIRNLHLRVKPGCEELFVSVPYAVTDAEILSFLDAHAAWIDRHYAACIQQKPALPLEDGAVLSLFGMPLPLVLQAGKRRGYSYRDGTLALTLTRGTQQEIQALLRAFYSEQLQARVTALLPLWCDRVGQAPLTLRYRPMTSRWGSCHTARRTVTLNLRLAFFSPACLEYVLVHELVHLRHANHGQDFYAMLRVLLPDWETRKALLNGQARAAGHPDPFQ